MTAKQIEQFNLMRAMLKRISRSYMTPAQIRKDAKNSGLDFDEYLEMSYENIQQDAGNAIRGIREIKAP